MKIKLPSKKYIVYGACAAGVAVCFITQCFNTVTTSKIAKRFEEVQIVSKENDSITAINIPVLPSEVLYRLYECGGKIGIYDAKTDILIDIIDVLASTLPKADRQALKKGIDVYTFADLAKIIDDFSS